MLTNNFLNRAKLIMLGSSFTVNSALKIKGVDNVEYYLSNANNSSAYPLTDSLSFTLQANNQGWSVGSGNTPAAVTDYNLETTITQGITGSVSQVSINDTTNNKIISRKTITITNASDAPITINEIGFKGTLDVGNLMNNTTHQSKTVLLYRHVLDTSVVLAPAEAVSFIIDFYIDLT